MRRIPSQRGSTLVISLIFLGVLMAAGGVTFSVMQNRYRQVHQTATWQEALLAAEAGVDLAVNEMRKELYDSSNAWSEWHNTPDETLTEEVDPTLGTAYYTSKVLLREGEGGQRSYSKISVDAPPFLRDASGEQWFRVRSLGVANIPGGTVAAGDKLDLRLRKFDLIRDHRTGLRVLPQATRLIEAIVKPVGTFRLALFGVKTINMNNHNIVVDSYDSRDPNKSTNGFYDVAKRQENGDIATNGLLIDAGSAHIYGDAATNGGTVLNAANVTGEIRNDFYQDLFAVTRPDVQLASPGTPSTITSATTIDAAAGDPIQVLVSQINLSGQNSLRIRGAADGSATYAQIIVSGGISTSGQAQIIVDPGVHLRVFVAGDVDIAGNGIVNTNSPLHLQFYGLDRATNDDGSPKNPGSMKIAGNGGFRGTVYAPSYDVTMVGGGNDDTIYGSFVGWTIAMTGVQSVHYDEALGDGGLISDYKVVSWFEDGR
jgi:hypothetical protein